MAARNVLLICTIILSNILHLNLTKTFDCTSSSNSCYGQELTCLTSDTTCTINCGGHGGNCSLATFSIQVTADKSNIAQIICNENGSCNGIKIYSQRALNMQCNENACNNAYVNVTWYNRFDPLLAASTLTITEANNNNFYFVCSGEGIGIQQCHLNCGPSIAYPTGGVTICSNGYFNCDLPQLTCIWDCINANYNYCYNNTLNCIAPDDINRCYKTNAQNSQVNPIYLTSMDPTKTPTNAPTSNVSVPTVAPNVPTPTPTFPMFEFRHILNFTLIMTTSNWTKDEITLTSEGMELFIKLLNETKDTIHYYVFQQDNVNDTSMGFYNQYHIKPGHCNIYDMNHELSNNSIYFDCELNSDNATVIYTINEMLSMSSNINQISNSIDNAIHGFLSGDILGPLANVGLIRIKFIYYSILIPTETPTTSPITTSIPTKTPTTSPVTTSMPSYTPSKIPTITPAGIKQVSTTIVTVFSQTLDKFNSGNESSDDSMMLIAVIIGCSIFLSCVICVLYCVHARRKHSVMDVRVCAPSQLESKSPILANDNDGNIQFTIPQKQPIIQHKRQPSEGPKTGAKYSDDGDVQIQLQKISESIDDQKLERVISEGPKSGSQYSENNDKDSIVVNEINETYNITSGGPNEDEIVDEINETPQQIYKLSSTISDNSIVNDVNEFVADAENDEEIIDNNIVTTGR